MAIRIDAQQPRKRTYAQVLQENATLRHELAQVKSHLDVALDTLQHGSPCQRPSLNAQVPAVATQKMLELQFAKLKQELASAPAPTFNPAPFASEPERVLWVAIKES